MRLAAIDIGTNSVHMIVARVHPHGRYEIIDSAKEMVRLGRGGLTEGVLMADAQDRAIAALHRMRKLATAKQVEEIVVVATSAVREAQNGGEFLSRVLEEVGLRVQVIQGQEEARLIYLAVRDNVDFRGDSALIIDIGGGSVEIITGTQRQALFMRSTKLGVARLREMFISKEPFPPRELRALQIHVRTTLLPLRKQIEAVGGFTRVIGTSGTVLNIRAMAAAISTTPLQPKGRDGGVLERRSLKALAKQLASSTPKTRERMPEYDPKRGDLTVVGATLLAEFFDVFKIDELTTCDRALREGVILDYVDKHRPELSSAAKETDLRKRSVRSLLVRYAGDEPHADRIAGFALQIFDALKPLHKLAAEDRNLLEYAALVHDIGYHISAESHHKHTYYLITQSRLPGFSSEDQTFIALIGRYHRKTKPKLEHPEFAELSTVDRRRLRLLSAMLKIADGLDRSHAGVVKKLRLRLARGKLMITVKSDADPELEIWAASRNGEAMMELLGTEVEVERA